MKSVPVRGGLCLTATVLLLVLAGCRAAGQQDGPLIGFSMDTLKEERWQRDRDLFVAEAERLGARVIVQSANSDDARQFAQCENMLTRGVDLLVVVPHNGKVAAAIVEEAHRSGVPVIAYDRIINDADLDLYIAFDNERIGELQAQYLVERAPRGNYVLIGGAPTDYAAVLYRKGQLNVLQPYIDRGEIRIVADQWAEDWQPLQALQHVENALTQNRNDVVAVVTSNDGTAGGAIQALAEQGLAGKVLVSGQDADLAAMQRLLDGTQSMTVYLPIPVLAETAAQVALKMIRGEEIEEVNAVIDNGYKEVPSILLEATAVDTTNLVETVIADGYHRLEDVYRHVPRSRWPAP